MTRYVRKIRDITVYCPYCKERWNGYKHEETPDEDIKCPKCKGKTDIVDKGKKPYDIPA